MNNAGLGDWHTCVFVGAHMHTLLFADCCVRPRLNTAVRVEPMARQVPSSVRNEQVKRSSFDTPFRLLFINTLQYIFFFFPSYFNFIPLFCFQTLHPFKLYSLLSLVSRFYFVLHMCHHMCHDERARLQARIQTPQERELFYDGEPAKEQPQGRQRGLHATAHNASSEHPTVSAEPSASRRREHALLLMQ